MPITYQPAQPFAPDISSRYGAAEQSYRDIPQILEARRMQLQQQQASEANAQAANQHAAALAQQGAQFRMGQQQSAYEQASNRNLDAAQFDARLQQAPALAQQHAELSAWVNQQEMTQADNMRMKNLQQAVSQINADMESGVIDRETGMGSLARVRGQVSPLEVKFKQEQTKKEQEQTAHIVRQNKLIDDITNARNDFFAGNFEKLPLITDPQTGKQHRMILDKNGVPVDPFKDLRADHSAADTAKADAAQHKAEMELWKDWQRAHTEATKTVGEWAKQMGPKDVNGVAQPLYPNLRDSDVFANHVNDIMLKKGYELVAENDVRKKSGKVGGAAPVAPGATQPGGGAQTAVGTGAAPSPTGSVAPAEVVARQVPFEPGKPATAEQQTVLTALEQSKGDIDRSTLSPEKKQQMKHESDTLAQWLAKIGGFTSPNLPPAIKTLYDSHLKALDGLQYPAAPKPLSRLEQFRRGELVTVEGVRKKLDKLNKGELVTLEDIQNLFK